MQGRLLDLCFFDITNLFCPRRYVLKDVVRDSNGQRGLTFFISILHPNIDVYLDAMRLTFANIYKTFWR